MESALMTSPSSSLASTSERSDLPTAVGPITAITGRSIASVWQRRVNPCTRDAAGEPLNLGGIMSNGDDFSASNSFEVGEDEYGTEDYELDDDLGSEDDEADWDENEQVESWNDSARQY